MVDNSGTSALPIVGIWLESELRAANVGPLVSRGNVMSEKPELAESFHRIVVGVDGSETSRAALMWAIEEAARRHSSVDAVTAWTIPVVFDALGGVYPLPSYFDKEEAEARAMLAEEVISAKKARPDLSAATIREHVTCGQASDVLLAASKGAELLVVGSRGRGGLSALLLGSVSHQVAHHSNCPLVIIPHER